MTHPNLKNNRAIKMLHAAEQGKYGVLGCVCYNMEMVIGTIRAAEAKRSPLQILLFPWAFKYSPLFVDFVAMACRSASVPVTLHMDHAQDPEIVRKASQIMAADGTPAFDSIMVDNSHHEKEENLKLTKELTDLCHERGIATEAEPGRIEGGEDGVKDTAELEGLMTTPEEIEEFVATGIDLIAPAFGNKHGEQTLDEIARDVDFARLEKIQSEVNGRVRIVLHGTNGFPPEVMKKCIERGVTRVNVNKLYLARYNKYVAENIDKLPLTDLMSHGTQLIQEDCERWIDIMGSAGKA